jgi:nucleotide-binding universal stress UspA family protein
MNILLAVDDSPAAAQAGEREVQAASEVPAASGFPCETAVRTGVPAQAILNEAAARRAASRCRPSAATTSSWRRPPRSPPSCCTA